MENAVSFTHQGTVLAIGGRLDSRTTPDAEKALIEAQETQTTGLIIDLSELQYISSAGLRIMLMAAKRAKKNSRPLVLCGLSASIQEIFRVSGFLKLFVVTATLDEAHAQLSA